MKIIRKLEKRIKVYQKVAKTHIIKTLITIPLHVVCIIT